MSLGRSGLVRSFNFNMHWLPLNLYSENLGFGARDVLFIYRGTFILSGKGLCIYIYIHMYYTYVYIHIGIYVYMYICMRKKLPIWCWGTFEVDYTKAVSGLWDNSVGNCWGHYVRQAVFAPQGKRRWTASVGARMKWTDPIWAMVKTPYNGSIQG